MVVGEFTQETDLVIIGGGPAGYSAAFRAAELGVQTILVESRATGALGGVCLHEGCIPSKTLLQIADVIHGALDAKNLGVHFQSPKLDHDAIFQWRGKTIAKLASGLDALSRTRALERISGEAHFEDSRNLAITGPTNTRIRFKRALIATGSVYRHQPLIPADGQRIHTPSQAMTMQSVPTSVLVVGHDYMAVEAAGIFAALGSEVTLATESQSLLPQTDPDLVRPLVKALQRRLKELRNDSLVKLAQMNDRGVTVTFNDHSSAPQHFDSVIVSAGQSGHVRSLHLERTRVTTDADQFIGVDEQLRTSDPRIFAAGDVTGPPLLANKAQHQGRIAAEVIAGAKTAFDARAIPYAIFTDPPIAWCGLTERDAAAANLPIKVAKAPWGASARAVGMGRVEGLTKIVYDPDSHLVRGVGLVGPHACELISEAALAIEMGATLTDLALTLHPHPTLSELLSDAARLADRR